MPVAVRIKRVRISNRFARQFQVSIPYWWIKENELSEGDFVDIMKDTTGRLILVPVKAKET